MTTTRTDIHRPSQITPADYDFVGFLPQVRQSCGIFENLPYIRGCRQIVTNHMLGTGGGYATHEHGGSCHVCGAYANDMAVWYHAATNEYIKTGITCAEHMDNFDVAAFRREARQARDARDFATGIARRDAQLEEKGMAHAIESQDRTVRDMLGRLRQYGSLSVNQWEYMTTLLEREANHAERQARFDAEREAAAPVPTFDGRVTVEMTVVGIKPPDKDAMYPCFKLILKHTDGWVLMGSRPASLEDVQRGDSVKFNARVKTSDRDPKFGFYSRPTKATITKQAAPAA